MVPPLFRRRLWGGLLGVRGRYSIGRGRIAVVFQYRPDGHDSGQDDTDAAECGPQSPGGLRLWSTECHIVVRRPPFCWVTRSQPSYCLFVIVLDSVPRIALISVTSYRVPSPVMPLPVLR